jgi:hypothetical protein
MEKKTWDEVFMDVERGKWRNGNKIGMRSSWIKSSKLKV